MGMKCDFVVGKFVRLFSLVSSRQNFAPDCETALNRHIQKELFASYQYQAMSTYFARDNVALLGFHQYFNQSSLEERQHAEMFMEYLNRRGGRVILESIAKPQSEWSALESLKTALDAEKDVNDSLLKVHNIASQNHDHQLCDFIEAKFLDEQVLAIKKASDLISNLELAGASGLGLYLFDRELKNGFFGATPPAA